VDDFCIQLFYRPIRFEQVELLSKGQQGLLNQDSLD